MRTQETPRNKLGRAPTHQERLHRPHLPKKKAGQAAARGTDGNASTELRDPALPRRGDGDRPEPPPPLSARVPEPQLQAAARGTLIHAARQRARLFFLSSVRPSVRPPRNVPGKETYWAEESRGWGGNAREAAAGKEGTRTGRDGTGPNRTDARARTHAVSWLRGGRIQDADTEAGGLG